MGTCVVCGKEKHLPYNKRSTCQWCYYLSNPEAREARNAKVRAQLRTLEGRYSRARNVAKKRKIRWHLTMEQYAPLISQACFYCQGPLCESGVGLDRLSNDRTIGYCIENVVPCCHVCNTIKGDNLSPSETLAALDAIRQRQRQAMEDVFERDVDVDRRLVFMMGEINTQRADTVLKALDRIVAINAYAPIGIILCSEGGDWNACMAIYERLRGLACPANITVYGEASSSASIILQAGTHRVLGKHAVIVVHDGVAGIEGSPKDVEAFAVASRNARLTMYRIYSERTGLSAEYWEGVCAHDKYFSANEALDVGLIDEILE